MTTKHTPGPWMIAVCPATGTPIVKAGRLTICSMAEGDADEHLSDQMLIAAAPADLSTLPYEASGPGEMSLTGLKYALADRNARQAKVLGCWPEKDDFAKRLWAEIPTRPEYHRAFGGRAA